MPSPESRAVSSIVFPAERTVIKMVAEPFMASGVLYWDQLMWQNVAFKEETA
ncbi:hypothetical protein [Marispirochaeta aestuarii]|uniref:hypothetical protein n=1 Tax=Marispirochaeta aestuarii TaxID=1963862 RepID=UPI002ABD3463|nr:hypothetical protein [Marispirochaeta aestuarii]